MREEGDEYCENWSLNFDEWSKYHELVNLAGPNPYVWDILHDINGDNYTPIFLTWESSDNINA